MTYNTARRQAGDTIIEVIIVLAVLGSALSLSYATANRSIANIRQAQENAQAAQYVQGQLEVIRAIASTQDATGGADPATNIYQAGSYCAYSNGTKYVLTPATDMIHCQKEYVYNLSVNYSSTADDTFTVAATWPDVYGQGTDRVALLYRLHKGGL